MSHGTLETAKLKANIQDQLSRLIMQLQDLEDLRAELMLDQSQYFTSEYDFQLIEKAGHFLHREQPQAVSDRILAWLKK